MRRWVEPRERRRDGAGGVAARERRERLDTCGQDQQREPRSQGTAGSRAASTTCSPAAGSIPAASMSLASSAEARPGGLTWAQPVAEVVDWYWESIQVPTAALIASRQTGYPVDLMLDRRLSSIQRAAEVSRSLKM